MELGSAVRLVPSPKGLVDAGTPPDPSSHYTTTIGEDKTTIPNTGIIGNTDNENSVQLSAGVCVNSLC